MSASDLLPSEYISNGWANCLHLTGKGENSGESSLTSVSLWFNKQGLLLRSAHNHWQRPSTDLPIINQWTTVVIDKIQKNDGKHLLSVSIAGKEVFSVEDTKPEKLVNVKVFASDPRLPAQPGSIRNLVIETGVDCEQKSRWEDGTCITSCPFCVAIQSPKVGFGEAREEKEATPEEKEESSCPSGLNVICETLGLDSLQDFVAIPILLLLLLITCCLAVCLCCCCCVLWQKKISNTRREKESDPNDPTPLETDNIDMTPKLREIADIRDPIDSFDYDY